VFLLASAPIYLSGHWELSPAGWLVLALFSCMPVLFASTPGAPRPARGALAAR